MSRHAVIAAFYLDLEQLEEDIQLTGARLLKRFRYLNDRAMMLG
jgi:hypothetical protein